MLARLYALSLDIDALVLGVKRGELSACVAAAEPGPLAPGIVPRIADHFCDLPRLQWLAGLAPKAHVVLSIRSYESRLHSLLAGDAIASLPRFHGDAERGLKRIDAKSTPAPVEDLWLAVHKDARNVRRVRTLIEAIVSAASKSVT